MADTQDVPSISETLATLATLGGQVRRASESLVTAREDMTALQGRNSLLTDKLEESEKKVQELKKERDDLKQQIQDLKFGLLQGESAAKGGAAGRVGHSAVSS